VSAVDNLLTRLRSAAYAVAQREHDELSEFARQSMGVARTLGPWDTAFWSERQRDALFNITDEALRPYFPLSTVMRGATSLLSSLFGVVMDKSEPPPDVAWHDSVEYYTLTDENTHEPLGGILLDMPLRPGAKRPGAWMDGIVGRSHRPDGSLRLPVAIVVLNVAPPTEGRPTLLSLSEVETVLHELGHALQHVLTTVDEPLAAGTRGVEWDAVELPSQMLQRWIYHPPTIQSMSNHVDTGETLPDDVISRLIAAKNYREGSSTLRQVYFARLDLTLHATHWEKRPTPDDVERVFRSVAHDHTIIPPVREDQFLCAFMHIFATDAYAAGYYSYKWAEVLAADAFAAFFERNEGESDREALHRVGKRFRETVLALGGSDGGLNIFKSFRGRAPDPDAMLREAGLLPTDGAEGGVAGGQWSHGSLLQVRPGQQTVNFIDAPTLSRLGFLLFVPTAYPSRHDWPVIVFLHGAGESGSDPEKVALQGPPALVKDNPDFPFVVVSPQNSARRFSSETMMAAVAHLVNTVARQLAVDRHRIYLTGVSMGGFGTWSIAAAYPDVFAAIAPICGGGNPDTMVAPLRGMPIWVWHGANDVVIPVGESDRMVKALRDAQPEDKDQLIRYTRLEHAPAHDAGWAEAGIPDMPGHASWVPACGVNTQSN